MSTVHAIYTVALLFLFLGIIAWAFGPARRSAFERAARSILDDAEDGRGAVPPDAERRRG